MDKKRKKMSKMISLTATWTTESSQLSRVVLNCIYLIKVRIAVVSRTPVCLQIICKRYNRPDYQN